MSSETNPVDSSRFDGFVELLGEVMSFYRRELTAFTIQTYWAVLGKYPLKQIQRAFSLYAQDVKRGRFAPYPSDILGFLDDGDSNAAQVAWHKVLQAVSRHGSHKSIVFDDPLIHGVLTRMGGWIKFCMSLNEYNESDKEEEFIRKYQSSMIVGNPSLPYPNHLIGRIESYNGEADPEKGELIFVGDEVLAQKVLSGDFGNNPVLFSD